MTQDCSALNLQLCRRQVLIGAALALCPLLNIPARAEDQPDETEKGPQRGDHLVFLSGPKKDQPARVEDLELGGEQLQTYPADPKGLVRDGTPLNLVLLARVGDDGLDEQTRKLAADGRCRLFGHMHASSLSGDPVVNGKKSHGLLMPWLHVRSQEQREGDLRTCAPAARRSAAEKRERRTDRRRRIQRSDRSANRLMVRAR
jgi:hypothetical protein